MIAVAKARMEHITTRTKDHIYIYIYIAKEGGAPQGCNGYKLGRKSKAQMCLAIFPAVNNPPKYYVSGFDGSLN